MRVNPQISVSRAPNLSLPGIEHGFFGRKGGVSTGIYESLNCGLGSGDDRQRVLENRDRAKAELNVRYLETLYQVHSPDVVTLTEFPSPVGYVTKGAADVEGPPQGDAWVTKVPGIALGILTADCAPVLFADEKARVIGAAHAGWKGALGGVIESTLAAMEALGARRANIAAAVGPCIAQANYEVGPEFRAQFLAAAADNAKFFVASNRPDHFRFDLEGYAAARLAAAGVTNVERLSADTYGRESDFFSFRRATHRGEKQYGRQVSAIVLS
ncbi:MAG: peptidoglycan editing factor PgeF [Rhizomicrobium sp.]